MLTKAHPQFNRKTKAQKNRDSNPSLKLHNMVKLLQNSSQKEDQGESSLGQEKIRRSETQYPNPTK